MASTSLRPIALMMAALVVTAAPSFAERDRRDGAHDGGRQRSERAQPRGESHGRVERDQRHDRRANEHPPRGNWGTNDNRPQDRRAYRGRYDDRAFDRRTYGNRLYDQRSYGYNSYRYRPYVNRSYRIPFGYRPYGYRPGWSLNLYFGRPYSTYGYPAAGYGYYALAPGRAYGSVRIVDAPPDAEVFVDGYYAGIVDDYDGVFQHLNLEVGTHHIEIEDPDYPPIAFDVHLEPGQTITYRANLP